MALVAGQLAARLDLLRGQSETLQSLADGLLAAEDARARVLFALTSQPLLALALDAGPTRTWRLDGEPMPMAGGVVAHLQDQRGLLSVNAPDRAALTRLLITQGVPSGQVDQLLDTLNDYTDTDDFRRLTGAEREEYQALGLLPPRNDWLDSSEELRQVIGWRDLGPPLDTLIPLLSSRRDGTFNPNTAPKAVLVARLPGASAEQIAAFIGRRQLAPFRSAAEARAVTGLQFNDDDAFVPGTSFRLRLRLPKLPMALEYNIVLTPESSVRPWHFVDSRTVFVPVRSQDEGGRSSQSAAELARQGPN